jgi:hypothetical protein
MRQFTKVALVFIALVVLTASNAMAVTPDFNARSQVYIKNNAVALDQFSKKVSNFVSEMAVSPNSIAPPVTSLEFTGVLSSMSQTWEEIQANQYITIQDHGGAEMYLEVVTIGYGIDNAKMNSVNMPRIATYSLTGSDSIVYGFINYYDASGTQNGSATVQSISQNYPNNTMTDSLTVQ